VIGKTGVKRVIELELSPEEREALVRSVEKVRQAQQEVDRLLVSGTS
jgi:malate/lactate dehydrogenase